MRQERWKTGVVAGAALVLALGPFTGAALGQAPSRTGARLPRTYEGAPPLVPHDVESRKGLCQECHATGAEGAPITPHPDRNHACVQCHVGQDLSVKPFVPSTWRR